MFGKDGDARGVGQAGLLRPESPGLARRPVPLDANGPLDGRLRFDRTQRLQETRVGPVEKGQSVVDGPALDPARSTPPSDPAALLEDSNRDSGVGQMACARKAGDARAHDQDLFASRLGTVHGFTRTPFQARP